MYAALAQRARAAEDEQYRARVETLATAFSGLARALAGVDGRKQVLYFSAGFDSRALVGQQGTADQQAAAQSVTQGRLWEVDGWARYGDPRLREMFTEMTRNLTLSDSVLHAVDVTGLANDASASRTQARSNANADAPPENSGREALNFLSTETGGRLFKNANDLGPALDEMLEMTSRYYVLGFQPAKVQGPGAFHKIRVRVNRDGVKVSHRAGYYEKTPAKAQTALQRQFEAAQLVMAGGAHDALKFSSLCLPFPRPGAEQALGLVLQVPRESLGWASGKGVSLEAYGYAVAEDGSVSDHMAKLTRLDLKELDPKDQARGVSLFGTLVVPPGRYTVRVMVRDADSGVAGVQLLEVQVPPYDPKVGFLLPPVVMDEVARWLNVEMGRSQKAQPASFPFEVNGQPFLPRASFELRSGRSERIVVFAYEPAQPGDPATDLAINTTLADHTGKLVRPGEVRVTKVERDAAGRRTYLLGYTPEALPAGEYTLRIGIGEGRSLLEAYSRVSLRPAS